MGSKSPRTYIQGLVGCSFQLFESFTSRVYTRGSSGEIPSRTAALRGRLHAAVPLEGATRAPKNRPFLTVVLVAFFCYGGCDRSNKNESIQPLKIDLSKIDLKTTLAEVEGYKITLKDLDDTLKEIPSYGRGSFESPQGKRNLLNKMIARVLLYKEGEKLGILKEAEFQKRFEDYKVSLVSSFVEAKYLNENRTDAAIKKYYLKNKDKYKKNSKIEDFDAVKNEVSADFSRDLLNDFIETLKGRAKISINQQILEEKKGE